MIEMMYVYEMKILDVRLRILVFVSIHRYYPTSLLPPHRTSNFGYLFISNFNYLFILISLDVRLFNSNFNYLFILVFKFVRVVLMVMCFVGRFWAEGAGPRRWGPYG